MNPAIARPVGRGESSCSVGFDQQPSLTKSRTSTLEASKRIVAVNRFYWPEEAPTSQLLTDLAEHLARSGKAVTIVTSRHGYRSMDGSMLRREWRNGVEIVRVWSSQFGRRHVLGRAVDDLTFYLSATLQMARHLEPGATLLVKTDPPLTSVPAALVARFKGARLVNWCQDLFPEVAAALGMKVATGPVGWVMRWLRNAALRSAQLNVAISDRMRDLLVDAGVAHGRVQVIHNWPSATIEPVGAVRNRLRQAWGLDQKFVIGYSGNLGRAHIPEAVFELVGQFIDRPDVRFLFVGEGGGMLWLKARCEQANHRHVLFKPYQPKDSLSLSLSVPDLHLVTLHPACEGLMMPSKLYGILAAAKPVLFLGDCRGAVADFLGASGAGLALNANAPETWVTQLAPILADRNWIEQRGAAARRSFEAAYTADLALARWSLALGGEAKASQFVAAGAAA